MYQDISPLIITEGNSKDKLKWIKRNSYLNFCYQQLSNISGALFIYGHSLEQKDKHIFDAINANKKIKTIYISVYLPDKTEDKIRENAEKIFSERLKEKSLKIDFYDAQSVNIW